MCGGVDGRGHATGCLSLASLSPPPPLPPPTDLGRTRLEDLFRPRPLLLPSPPDASCITHLKAQGPSRTCNESKEEEEASPPDAVYAPPSRSHFWNISSTFGDICPQNGSKNEQRAPRTSMGCPPQGPSVCLWLKKNCGTFPGWGSLFCWCSVLAKLWLPGDHNPLHRPFLPCKLELSELY